ncbi:hypothetical protein BDB00DRAFT_806117 [Zychaea mexicana]|uniref:uncharacterized protein n=1 Tax=Zychaea mexicana TaxID=64656 RepID=UPI0022FDFF49|nr:uncharacterized protein BDB00DRAFT_806117 [Zychaea mexicana]KAI9496944.1 hypothetical protein BDB00DRAFT_806117 [Zychaea mexicana]
MNFSFEGNFKQKRNINLGGKRVQDDKKTLIAKAQADRRAREQERLRLRSAIKIQSFFRGRREAAIVRQQRLGDLHNLLQQLSSNSNDSASIAHCIQTFLLRYNKSTCDAATASHFCRILLPVTPSTTKDASTTATPITSLFSNTQQPKEADIWSWRVILFINRILLPILYTTTSSSDIPSILQFLAVAVNPDTYATANRDAYLRIMTNVLIHGDLLRAIQLVIIAEDSEEYPEQHQQGTLVSNVLDIVTNVIRCQPPYNFAPSIILQWRPAPIKPVMMSGLFGGGTSSSTKAETEENDQNIRLNRDLVVDLIAQNILSIPFFVDKLSPTVASRYMHALPFEMVLKSIIRLNDRNAWAEEDRAAGLLINITQLAKIDSDVYLERALELYAQSIQALLSNIPPSYFAEPKPEELIEEDSDFSDDSDVERGFTESRDTVMTEARVQADPRIKERLELLYDTQHIDILVRHFINMAAVASSSSPSASAATSPIDVQEVSGEMACLFNTLMTQWPSKKDSILNTLLYHRWWSDTNQTVAVHLAQFFWRAWSNHPYAAIFDDDDRIMDRLPEALRSMTDTTGTEIWAILYLLCEMYTKLLLTIGDDEFFDKTSPGNQLTLQQIIRFSRHLKNLSFTLFWRAGSLEMENMLGNTGIRISQLRSTVTHVLQQIHRRDSRRSFCPIDHWLIKKLDSEGFSSDAVAEEFSLENDPEQQSRQPSKTRLALISPRLGVLNNIPFVIPFEQRVAIFRMFVQNDRQRNSLDFYIRPAAEVTIRRDHVFEDGFTHLYALGTDLKKRISISFVDEFGLQEAGIDGGGVFKEFLTSLSREAFDTNYGLFRATPDQLLYPNPSGYAIESSQLAYFEFLGLIIGKAVYEGILLDVAFAEFFLKKCLGGMNYLDDLPSLDPELYNGLIAVKNFQGNVEDLSLDFSITDSEYGEARTVDLIPNGSNIPVTNANRIPYVYRVANYRLNIQIAKQSRAFFRGLSTIVDVKWLRMFNQTELQVLLGGASVPIDLEDLRAHTVYSGYTEQDDTVKNLWKALYSFNNEERMKFVKFVTSCSRPPLLGFKELRPQICVRLAGADDGRLPTSSTCINLLKLPQFSSYSILREKLSYAINAEAGFDLS